MHDERVQAEQVVRRGQMLGQEAVWRFVVQDDVDDCG